MAWSPRYTRNGIEYGGSSASYYWDININPNATFQYCLANCTTYAYGRQLEAGRPKPVTRIVNAELWHTVVNYAGDWSRIEYTTGMLLQQGDIVEWEARHVAVCETNGTNPIVSASWYTDDNGHAYGNRTPAVIGGSTLQAVNDFCIRNYPTRFFHTNVLTDESRLAGDSQEPSWILRYTGEEPTPPTPEPEEPEISISPSAPVVSLTGEYVDITFNITMSGIPQGESADGGNTYPGLLRVYNTGWSYSSYTVDGVTYRRATKTQTLRYYRASIAESGTILRHMYFNKTFSNGSINSDTVITIVASPSSSLYAIVTRGDKENEFMIKLI